MIGTIFSLIFSKFGGIALGVGALFLALWGKKRAENRAAKAEARVQGMEAEHKAATKHQEIDQEVLHAQEQTNEQVAGGDVDGLIGRFNDPK